MGDPTQKPLAALVDRDHHEVDDMLWQGFAKDAAHNSLLFFVSDARRLEEEPKPRILVDSAGNRRDGGSIRLEPVVATRKLEERLRVVLGDSFVSHACAPESPSWLR